MKKYLLLALLIVFNFTLYTLAATPKKGEEEPKAMTLPNIYEFHVNNGYKYIKSKKYDLAIKEFEAAQIIKPDYYKIYRGLGDVYRALGNIKRALENYKQAIDLINPVYLKDKWEQAKNFEKQGKLVQAFEVYKYILLINPQAGAQVIIGDRAIRRGEKKVAIKAYEKAIELDKWYADPYFKLGNIYYEDKKYPKALPYYEQARKLIPQNPTYNYQLGMTYLKLGKKGKKIDEAMLANAIKFLEFAFKYNYKDKNLPFNLGTAYLERGLFIHSNLAKETNNKTKEVKKQVVIKSYEKAIEYYLILIKDKNKTKDPEVYYNIANAYHKYGELMNEEIEKYQNYGDEVKLDYVWRKTTILYNNAAKTYRMAIKLKPDYAQAYYDLGVLYYRKLGLKPDANNLDIPNKKIAEEYGSKGLSFYPIDIGTRAIESFTKYLELTKKEDPKVKQIIEDIKKEAGLTGGGHGGGH